MQHDMSRINPTAVGCNSPNPDCRIYPGVNREHSQQKASRRVARGVRDVRRLREAGRRWGTSCEMRTSKDGLRRGARRRAPLTALGCGSKRLGASEQLFS